MRHENQQNHRHSGQRFLLIRNPGFSTVCWIPGQARYDGFLVNGTAVILFITIDINPTRFPAGAQADFSKDNFTLYGRCSRGALLL